MSKITKKIIQVLMILCAAVVLGAGIFWFGYFTQHPYQAKTAHKTENETPFFGYEPEERLDQQISASVRNYTESYNDDGTISRKIFTGSVEYLTAEGTFEPIDTSIVKSNTEEYKYENTTNVTNTFFKDDVTAQNFISYNVPGDRGVDFTYVDANTSNWKADGNTVTYSSIYEGIDAKYTINPDILLEELILNEYQDINKIDQKIKLNGVYYKEEEDGSITFHDINERSIVFTIPPPVMYELNTVSGNEDEETQPSINYGLHYEITEPTKQDPNFDNDTEQNEDITADPNFGTIIISKVLDEEGKEWLKNAKYPLAIDNSYAQSVLWSSSGGIRQMYNWCNIPPDSYNYNPWTGEGTLQTMFLESGALSCYSVTIWTEYRKNAYFSFWISAGVGKPADFSSADVVGAHLVLRAAQTPADAVWDGIPGGVCVSGGSSGAPCTELGNECNDAGICTGGSNPGTYCTEGGSQCLGGGVCSYNSFGTCNLANVQKIPVYVQTNAWPYATDFSTQTAAWYKTVYESTTTGTKIGEINPVGLPSSIYSCNSDPSLCTREFLIDKSNLIMDGVDTLNVKLSAENLNKYRGQEFGISVYGTAPTLAYYSRSYLQIDYIPKPQAAISSQNTDSITINVTDNTYDEIGWSLQSSKVSSTGPFTEIASLIPTHGTGSLPTYGHGGYVSYNCSATSRGGCSNKFYLTEKTCAGGSNPGTYCTDGGGQCLNGGICNYACVNNGFVWDSAGVGNICYVVDHLPNDGTTDNNPSDERVWYRLWTVQEDQGKSNQYVEFNGWTNAFGVYGFPNISPADYHWGLLKAYSPGHEYNASDDPPQPYFDNAYEPRNQRSMTQYDGPNPGQGPDSLGPVSVSENAWTRYAFRVLNGMGQNPQYPMISDTRPSNAIIDFQTTERTVAYTYSSPTYGSTTYGAWQIRYLGWGYPTMSPFNIAGQVTNPTNPTTGALLDPDTEYIIGVCSLGKNGNLSCPATWDMSNQVYRYTRTRTPRPPEIVETDYSNTHALGMGVRIRLTGNGTTTTPASATTRTNNPGTSYAIEVCDQTHTLCDSMYDWNLMRPMDLRWPSIHDGIIDLNNPADIEPHPGELRCGVKPEDPLFKEIPYQYGMATQYIDNFIGAYADIGGPYASPGPDWQGTTGVWIRNLLPNTCYKLRATSVKPFDYSGVSDLFDRMRCYGEAGTKETDVSSKRYIWSNDPGCPLSGCATLADFCTPPAPPSQPTVSCNYDVAGVYAMQDLMQYYAGIRKDMEAGREVKKPLFNIPVANAIIIEPIECLFNGNDVCDPGEDDPLNLCYYPDDCGGVPPATNDYYCEADIIDNINPNPVYYNIQSRPCNLNQSTCSATWTNVLYNGSTWYNDPGGIVRQLGLTCNLTSSYYQYRVRASHQSNGGNPSDWSQVGGDSLPPCTPGQPTYSSIGVQSINWTWAVPSGGEILTSHYLYQNTFPTGSNPSILWNSTVNAYPWTGLLANQSYYLNVSGRDARAREGAKSAQSLAVYTLADNPSISVTCGYSGSNYCRINLTSHNLNDPISRTPTYCLGRYNASLLRWEFYNYVTHLWESNLRTTCNYGVTNNQNYWRSAKTDYTTSWELTDSPLICDKTYKYKMEAKNTAGIVTTVPAPVEVIGITPPCPPNNLNHSANNYNGSSFGITWTWTNPVGYTYPVNFYASTDCTGTLLGTADYDDPGFYKLYGTYASYGNTNLTVSACYDAGGGVLSQPATTTAYTAVQNPTGVQLSNVSTAPTSQIKVTRLGRLTNVNDLRPAVYYDYYSSNGGTGGTDSGWYNDGNDDNTGSYTDTGLDANYQYCYWVIAVNNQRNVAVSSPPVPGEIGGDVSQYSPISCLYTYANIPSLPIRKRVDENTINLIIRSDDGNPHGLSGSNDTEYAICVTEYSTDGGDDLEAYVNKDTGAVEAFGKDVCHSGNYGETQNWLSRGDGPGDGWAGDSGVNITGLDPSKKYGFKVKAANGDHVATNFGPTATLFLVRNNVVGWAWSANIGWVSMNCLNLFTNPNLGYSCDTAEDWGINTNFEPTREINPLEGYGWASSGLQIHDWLTGNINKTKASSFSMHYNNSKTEMVLDSQGHPHIVWSEYNSVTGKYDIYYLKKINNVWQTANGTTYQPGVINPDTTGLNVSNNHVYSSNVNSLWPSLALDSDDNPHIAWNEGGWTEIEWANQQVYYTSWNGTAWNPRSRVDALDNGGSTPSLKLSSSGQPYVAFMHGWYNQGTEIYVRKLESGVWTDANGGNDINIVNVSQSNLNQSGGGYSNNGSLYPDLELDSSDNPHVAWRQFTMDGPDTDTDEDVHIYYKKWNGSAWVSASNSTENNVCSDNFADDTTGCVSGNEQATCGWFCNDNALNPNANCTTNNDCLGRCVGGTNNGLGCTTVANCPGGTSCDRNWATCEHNQCVKQNLSVNADLYQLGITSDPNGFDLNTTWAGNGAPDLALYSDGTPGILFSDSYYFTLYRRWDGNDWVDVDGGPNPNDNVWINKNEGTDKPRWSKDNTNYSLAIVDDVPYITWTGKDHHTNYNDIMVRFWNVDVAIRPGAWTTVSGDYGGGANFDDNKLIPHDVDNTHASNSDIAVDSEGNVHVAWSEITTDNISDCGSDADCTNPLYGKCYDNRCTRTCSSLNKNADCTNSLYPQCIDRWPDWFCGASNLMYSEWEAQPNKSGLGWISFNKYVCTNDTQQGCSILVDSSAECGGTGDCVVSADTPPDSDFSYGYCYQDDTEGAKKFGVCSTNNAQKCLEDNVSGCDDPTNARCILETCQTGDVCSDYDGGAIIEDCRDTATANFSGESRQIQGWARILSSKEQGEKYIPALTDWGWVKLGGNYDDGQGDSGPYNLSGTEIDAQLFLEDADVSADSLALYTLLGWGWNADITNYNSLSEWLTPTQVSDNANYLFRDVRSYADQTTVVDSNGDVHMAWSQYNEVNDSYDIYYAKLEGGLWKTASGEVYDFKDTSFDENTSDLDVSYGSGLASVGRPSRFPSLALDNNNNPHIAAQSTSPDNKQGGEFWVGADDTEIFYTYWNGSAWTDYSVVESEPVATPSLALNDQDVPYVAFMKGEWVGQRDIYLRVWNGDAWNTITDDNLNLNVSNTPYSDSMTPKLKIQNGAPHITWEEETPRKWPVTANEFYNNGNHIFYRYWNGSAWVSADDGSASVCSNNFNFNTCADESDCGYCINNNFQACTNDSQCGYCEGDYRRFCTSDATCTGFGSGLCITSGYCTGNHSIECTDNTACVGNGVCNTLPIESNRCTQGSCVKEAVSVNWGIKTCGGLVDNRKCYDNASCFGYTSANCIPIASNINGYNYGMRAFVPELDFFSNGWPGILFNDSFKTMFRQWDGSKWTEMDDNTDNLVLNPDSDEESMRPLSLVIDDEDRPHVSWSANPFSEIVYLFWDGGWVTANGNNSHYFDTPGNAYLPSTYSVSNTNYDSDWYSTSTSVTLDQWGNQHLSWIDTKKDPTDWQCGPWINDGVVSSPDNAEALEAALSPDNRYLYIVGTENSDWYIQKRRADNGNLVTAFDGDGIIDYSSHASYVATDLAMDPEGKYLYIIGREDGGSLNMRIEKHRADDGRLCTGGACNDGDGNFGDSDSGVIVIPDTGTAGTGRANHSNASIEYKDGYIYSVGTYDRGGTDESDDWYIDKRDADTGDLVYGFGDRGVVISEGGYGAQWITIDENFMYVIGAELTAADDQDWRIEKRYLSNGQLVSEFANKGVFSRPAYATSVDNYNSEQAFQAVVKDDYLYVAGNYDDDYEYFLIAKINKNTGLPDASFGVNGFLEITDYYAHKAWAITADDDYIYFGGYTGDSDNSKWRIEKIDHDGNRPAGSTDSGWVNGIIFEDSNNHQPNNDGAIGGIVNDDNYLYIVGSGDISPAPPYWRLEKRWKSSGVLDRYPEGISSLDCPDPDYPVCIFFGPHTCAASKLMYTRWTPGNVQGGVGWVEFMPAGALLGVPWVQTAFADIFGSAGVNLAAPPRGSGEFTATYLILSNGNIQGIPTNYSGNYSQSPTSRLYEYGLNPLIEGSSLPFGEDALSKINVDGLIISPNADGKNKYGYDLVPLNNSVLTSSQLTVCPVGENFCNSLLDNSVYYFNGNASIDQILKIQKGDSTVIPKTAGDGLIVIDGDLEINADIYYQKECSDTPTTSCLIDSDCPVGESCVNLALGDISEMQSLAFIVRGNIYISPFVTNIDAVLIALDNPDTLDVSEGFISTSRQQPTKDNTDISAENDTYITYDGVSYNAHNIAPGDQLLKFGQDSSIYQYRRKIKFADMADLGEIGGFPLMVKINSKVDPIAPNIIWDSVNSPDEIAFTDANGVALDFHFEYFNYAGTADDPDNFAVAWVEVPTLTTDGNDYIWIYYDTSNGTNQEDEAGTYDDNFKAVYHLSEIGTNTRENVTQYSHDAIPVTYEGNEGVTNGQIDGADQMDGQYGTGANQEGQCVGGTLNGSHCYSFDPTTCSNGGGLCDTTWVPDGDYLDAGPNMLGGTGDFTVEAWFKTNQMGRIIEQSYSGVPQNDFSRNYAIKMEDNGRVHAYAQEWINEDRDGNGVVDGARIMWDLYSTTGVDLSFDAWHQVVLQQDNGIDGARLFIDGNQVDVDDRTADLIEGVVNLNTNLRTMIGAKISTTSDYPKLGEYFNGSLDEITVSDTRRSDDWIKASYRNGLNTLVSGWDGQENVSSVSQNRTFLRWAIGPDSDLDIPPGSEILDAHLELTGTGTSFGNVASRIYLIEDDNIASLDSFAGNDLYNVSVTNSIAYNTNIADWNNNGINITPDIKALINRFIKSDKYAENYYKGDPTYIGLAIQEDAAAIGGFREFVSAEGSLTDSPKLVVEYSPHRVRYGLNNTNNDTVAWINFGTKVQDTGASLHFGWVNILTTPKRSFLRFAGIDLPVEAQILEAHIRANTVSMATPDTLGFQVRQALLSGYPNFFNMYNGTDMYDFPMDLNVSEVSEQIEDGQWAEANTSENIVMRDITTLVESFIARDSYQPGEAGSSEFGLRIRRGSDSIETIPAVGESRNIQDLQSSLEVDYLMPLKVNGLMVAKGFNFDRKYTRDLAPSERIVYDGRVLANTPPGLSDFTKTLPIYQRVAP